MTSPEFRPDLSCPVCQTPYVVTGDTPIARDRAIRDWNGCCVPGPANWSTYCRCEAHSLNECGCDPHDEHCAVAYGHRTCTCSPNPLAATGPHAVTARATNVPPAPPTSGPDTGADDRSPSAPSLLRRWFSGVPAHVRRRIGVWPFDPSDFTT